MNHNEKKIVIEKLMKDELRIDEKQSLANHEQVSEYMRHQWDMCGDTNDATIKSRIFSNIKKELWENKLTKQIHFYKLSLVASVALIVGLCTTLVFFSKDKDTNHIFIASSGIQNMESIKLPDGSVVQLGAGSKLTYPEKFNKDTREVTLNGQAFFDVETNPDKPFIVHTSQMEVTVLGTAFELFSYEIENKIEAILLNGKVNIKVPRNLPDAIQEIILLPNEKLTFDKQTKILYKESIDADKYTSWRKRGILTFENEKLAMIIPRLEQWYGHKIICQKDIADTYRFTFKVRDESLERILYILGKSSPIKYEKTEGGEFILSR